MKKENLIWLAVGGLAVYLLFFRKPAAASNGANTKPVPPSPNPISDSEAIASMFSNEELLEYYKNKICSFRGGALTTIKEMPPSKEKLEMDSAVRKELAKRKLTGKCIDYGAFPPPTSR